MSLANKFGIPQGLLDAAKAALEEANEYQKKVQAHMAKKGIKSMNDMTPDQKKKFFNELDAMHTAKHEEVESVKEGTSVTDYTPKSQGGTRKELLAKYHKTKNPKDAEAARRAGATQKELQGVAEEVESVEEELKGDMHPGAKKVLKHIKPEHHGTYKPYLKKGTYKGDYKDRAAVLSAAEKAGHVKEEFTLTQEDLDFIASLNQIDEVDQAEVVEGQLRNFSPHSDLAGRGRLSGYNKTAAGKKREADRETERLKDKMKFTKSQGGIAGPKGKLPEEFELDEGSGSKEKQHDRYVDRDSEESKEKVKGARERMASDEKAKAGKKLLDKIKLKKEDVSLDDFTVEEIEEYMQTEEFAQLDELSKETLGSYVKKRSHDVATQGALTRKHAMDSEAKKKEQNYRGARESDDKANKAFMKGWKHRQGIGRAVDKMVNKG